MSNKRSPTEPSYFVSSILRPLKVFFAIGVGEGFGASLKEDFLQPYAVHVFENVSQRFVHHWTLIRLVTHVGIGMFII
jgi:conserved oligomeric Golgi complex subunit 2